MLRAIIIDDEAHTRQNIRKMITLHCPDVNIIAEADAVSSGVEAIRNFHPDLIFLDIKMEDGTGFDLLEQLKPVDFKVIFITAWDNYAIRAFKFSAIDYLLKPLDPDDLTSAVEKAGKVMQKDFNTQLENLHEHIESQDKRHKKIIIRTSDKIFLVSISDLLCCESEGNYTTIRLTGNRSILASNSLKEYEDMLKDYGFFRVHKSYLINMKYITRFEKAEGGSVVLEGEVKIPVASRKKEMLLEMFDRLAEK
jgi:two-component system, LytTR family, response regulator